VKFHLFLILCLSFVACNSDKPIKETNLEHSVSEKASAYFQQIDPTKIDYLFNEKRGNMMFEQMKSIAYPEKLNVQLLYIKELIRSNKLQEAVLQVEQAKQAIADANLSLPVFVQQKFLILEATIYLRQGELENCLENHQSTSCIIPFTSEAQHTLLEGSSKAIPILRKVLQLNPDNKEAIWLINIAYETLGKSRESLDKKWRIDFGKPGKQAWENKSGLFGIDQNGLAGGVVADDFNNDGTIDLIFSAWGEEDHLHYFANYGNEGFVDETQKSGLDLVFGALNINHTDFNNDGNLDVFVMRGGWFETQGEIPNSLLRNNGDGTFTDVTESAGLFETAPTQSSSWIDINLDGWLDLFVVNESSKRAQFTSSVFMNNKDETFTNRTAESGFTKHGFFKGITPIKLGNNKHKSSFFISDYKGANVLLENQSTTENISLKDNTSVLGISGPTSSFSCWAFDYNNDGSEDIFVSGYGVPDGQLSPSLAAGSDYLGVQTQGTPILYVQENGKFKSLDLDKGLNKSIYTMGSNFGDLDNDGNLDLYLATGDPAMASIVPNIVYKNNGTSFEDISFETGMAHLQKGHGVAFADFDQDGDEDIYVVLGGAYEGDVFQNAYFENPTMNKVWIQLNLRGVKSNKMALGAWVELHVEQTDGSIRKLYRTVGSGSSFGGNSFQLEIGLGTNAKSVEKCIISWPFEGLVDTVEKLEINKAYRITEGGEVDVLERENFRFKVKSGAQQHHH